MAVRPTPVLQPIASENGLAIRVLQATVQQYLGAMADFMPDKDLEDPIQ